MGFSKSLEYASGQRCKLGYFKGIPINVQLQFLIIMIILYQIVPTLNTISGVSGSVLDMTSEQELVPCQEK